MHEISKILAVVDPTAETQPAMQRAAWLAQHTGAQLELLICYYSAYLSDDPLFESPSLGRARHALIADEEHQLEALAEPFRKEGVVVKTTALWDHPLYEGIVRDVANNDADIVFKDTHHHSAMSRALLSNTDWNLIRTCPTPLWLVKPQDLGAQPAFVAAIDPMHEHDKPAALDGEILQFSKMLSQQTGGVVHAFHCVSPSDEMEQQMLEDHRQRFHEITSLHQIEDENAHLASGIAHEELPAFANRINAGVVVMGAVARNRWKRLFIGATAERTLEYLPCDLLIVKPDWFRTPVDLTNPEAA